MANINLLPEELRRKEKAERKITTPYKIELTSPPKEKGGKVVKEGGALSFFRTAFKKPATTPKVEEKLKEPAIRIMPEVERQRILKPHVVFAKPKKERGPGLWQRFINWLKRLFAGKQKLAGGPIISLPPKKEEARPPVIKKEEGFPKIKPQELKVVEPIVKKEVVIEKPKIVFKEAVLEEIEPREIQIQPPPPKLQASPEKQVPLIPKPTLWERLSFWFKNLLKNLFGRKKKVKVQPPEPKPLVIKQVMPETIKKVEPRTPEKLVPELKVEEEKIVPKIVVEPTPLPRPAVTPPPPPPLPPTVELKKPELIPQKSLWQRFSAWLKSLLNELFGRKKKEEIKPSFIKEIVLESTREVQPRKPEKLVPELKVEEEKPVPKLIVEPTPLPPPTISPPPVPLPPLPRKEEPFKPKPVTLPREIVLEEIKPRLEKLAPEPEIPPILTREPELIPRISFWQKFKEWLKKLFNRLFKKKKKEIKPISVKELIPEFGKKIEPKIIPKYKEIPKQILETPSIKEPPISPPPPPPIAPTERKEFKEPEKLEEKVELKQVPKPIESKVTKLSQPQEISEKARLDQFSVNLVPEEIREKLIPKNRLAILFIIILAAIVFNGLIYIGLKIYFSEKEIEVKQVEQEISRVDTDISKYSGFQTELINLKDKAASVKKLLDRHVYWTKFLSYLEKYTIPEVYFTNMAADIGGVINLSAVGTDYESVARQYLVLKNASDFVNNLSITSVTTTSTSISPESILAGTAPAEAEVKITSVGFSISLTVTPDIFYNKTP